MDSELDVSFRRNKHSLVVCIGSIHIVFYYVGVAIHADERLGQPDVFSSNTHFHVYLIVNIFVFVHVFNWSYYIIL
jgi:hypothetical protein